MRKINWMHAGVGAVLALCLVSAPAVRAKTEVSAADVALAVRLADLARMALRSRPEEANWRQAAALLKAATRCDPNEARYARLLADAYLRLNDRAGALEALSALRKLRPEDRVAQLEVVTLYLSQMEMLDRQVAYLGDLVGRPSVAPEVRSEAARLCAELLVQKGDLEQAQAMVEQAISLNPLNLRALTGQFYAKAATAGPVERVRMLLAMLRSNPAQAAHLSTLARELAAAGLHAQAVEWYSHALNVARRSGTGIAPEVALDYASALAVDEHPREARQILDQLIAGDPEHYAAIVLRIALARRGEQKEVADQLVVQARNALLNRLAIVRGRLGASGATTRPVKEGAIALPDLKGDLELWKEEIDETVKEEYLQAVGDLAWFEIYFGGRADEAERVLQHFQFLADESSRFAARVAGWIYLAQGRTEEAKAKLSAAGAEDPWAVLGLIRAAGGEAQGGEEAQKLLSAHSAGVLGALLHDALRESGMKAAAGEEAPAILEALAKFPQDWMQIIGNPRAFYSLVAEPLQVSHQFGEPLLARVSIQNTSQFDLTIGPDGVIQPGLWIDVELRGLYKQMLPDLVFERITEQMVLKPRQSVSVIVRVDQGILSQELTRNVMPSIGMVAYVTTNRLPMAGPEVFGPAGQRVRMLRAMERAGFQATAESLDRVAKAAISGETRERLRQVHLAGACQVMMRGLKDRPDAAERALALLDALQKATEDRDPAVRAWAGLVRALYAPLEDRPAAIQRMLRDRDWRVRLLAVVALSGIEEEQQKVLAAEIAGSESDELVQEFAAAAVEVLKKAPETQPSAAGGPVTPGR